MTAAHEAPDQENKTPGAKPSDPEMEIGPLNQALDDLANEGFSI